VTDAKVRDLLDDLFDDEPRLPDAAVAVFGQADKLRRRRRRRILVGATVIVVLVALGGNALTELLVPTAQAELGGPAPTASASAQTAAVDPLLALAVDDLGPDMPSLRLDERGDGWRRFSLTEDGTVTGMLEVVLYSTTAGLCLPPTPEPADTCVRMPVKNGVQFYTYSDSERRFAEVIAVRQSDARAYAVHAVGNGAADGNGPATGETSAEGGGKTGDEDGGADAAPLSVTALKRLALDTDLPDTFGPDEWCDRPDLSCPTLGVPAPPDKTD
jgi:hypothetical protein